MINKQSNMVNALKYMILWTEKLIMELSGILEKVSHMQISQNVERDIPDNEGIDHWEPRF